MQNQLVPAANEVGDEVGRVIGRYMTSHIADAFVQGIRNGGRQAQAPATRQGQATGGAFARSFKGRVEAALRDLPDVELRADASDAEREIHAIRAQLLTLRDTEIGVDIDATEAQARIARLQERLTRLSTSSADVNVRLDAGAAQAQLAAFQAEINRLDGQDINVDVDTRSAAANFNLLTTSAIAFGPAILPVLPVVAAGLGAIAAAGTAAAAGIGAVGLVAVPAFKQIGGVLQAQKAAQDAATQSTNTGGQAAAAASSRALQLASAQQAVATAERNGARQIAQAQAAVTQARRTAAQAAARAAQAVEDAEDALADSQRAARKAQEDLTAARRTAAQELEDLNTRLTDSVLSQRDAEIGLKEATLERDAVLKDAKSTELDKQKALLQYDQAVQRLKEQNTETGRLKKETAAANKAGVEGSQTVKSAQEQVAQAQDTVADRTKALQQAQAAQAQTAQDNAAKIAQAQENVAVAQQSAADAAASAARQLQQASQTQASAAGTADAAATAQAKYRAELAKLTPSARGTLNAFVGLQTAFNAWSRSLQPAVMPIFTRALIGIRNTLPTLTPFVLGAADAIGILQDKVSAELKKPFWQGFKADLQGNVKPAIIGLGVAFGNVFKGIAGIIDAFLPHMDGISSTMQRITGKFATWATGLKGSPEFERFLSYSADKAPLIADTLGKIATAFLNIGTALSPLSGPLLQLLGTTASILSNIATYLPELVIGIYGLYVGTKLWAAAQVIANGAMIAFNAITFAGPWGWILVAIAAVALAVLYMYRRFDWFRAGIQAIWSAIQTASMWLWTNVLQPVFAYIWTGLKQLGTAAMWLWTNAIKPAWDAISLAARILLTVITVAVILPIVLAVKVLGAVIGWLWEKAFKPALQQIGDQATWLWKNAIKPAWAAIQVAATFMWEKILRPIFRNFVEGMRQVGRGASALYTGAIKPAWDSIVSVGKYAWEKGIKPVFDSWKTIIKGLGGVFGDAVDSIKTQWDKLKSIARRPIQYVVDTVYNRGIVGVWSKVADAFGAPPLKEFHFARGGVMPGYTPGRDVHRFVSPTGGRLELSGGEAIMRPEFTRAVGSGFVNSMNALARSRGAQGVKAALAPVFGGNPMTATDTTLRYADGGVFGWIGKGLNKVAGAGSAAWNKVKEGVSWLGDTILGSAKAGVKAAVNPLLKGFPGLDTRFGQMARGIPTKLINALFGFSKTADKKGGAGGVGGPRIQEALKWAKAQAGKPYIWGGVGPKGFDCSGFMGAIENVIRGLKPNTRRWATGAFSGNTAPAGWVKNGSSAFRIGITNAGVGHTAGTLGKTNVESRGGQGVVVGKSARGYNNPLFTSWYGFQPGKYDSGGYLQPGMNLAFNGTGRPEPVFTSSQANALMSAAKQQVAVGLQPGDSLSLVVDDQRFTAYVDNRADNRVSVSQQRLIQSLNAS